MTAFHPILVIDDDASIRTVIAEALRAEQWDVTTVADRSAASDWLLHNQASLIITDVLLPDGNMLDHLVDLQAQHGKIPMLVISAHATLDMAMRANEQGAADYLPKPFDLDDLSAAVNRLARPKSDMPQKEAASAMALQQNQRIVGRSESMQRLYREMGRSAQTDLSVLILGESGSGKELVARALHDYSNRRDQAFISVNMAAIPESLIEAELFGHKKGAFTGANEAREGHFAMARGGTLFLDEIGDMPIDAQTRLLRVLQDGDYRPIGSEISETADVRVIAATHQDLAKKVAEGSFRQDLYFRLNVIPLTIPALRDRLDDLDDLVPHFIQKAKADLSFTPGARALLKNYQWPGNVRELENLILRLSVIYRGIHIDEETLSPLLVSAAQSSAIDRSIHSSANLREAISQHLDRYFAELGGDISAGDLYSQLIREFERPLIEKTLAVTKGNQLRAAQILGLNRNTLRQRIRDLDIDIPRQ